MSANLVTKTELCVTSSVHVGVHRVYFPALFFGSTRCLFGKSLSFFQFQPPAGGPPRLPCHISTHLLCPSTWFHSHLCSAPKTLNSLSPTWPYPFAQTTPSSEFFLFIHNNTIPLVAQAPVLGVISIPFTSFSYNSCFAWMFIPILSFSFSLPSPRLRLKCFFSLGYNNSCLVSLYHFSLIPWLHASLLTDLKLLNIAYLSQQTFIANLIMHNITTHTYKTLSVFKDKDKWIWCKS